MEHLNIINFPFETNGKFIKLDVPILKHITVNNPSIILQKPTDRELLTMYSQPVRLPYPVPRRDLPEYHLRKLDDYSRARDSYHQTAANYMNEGIVLSFLDQSTYPASSFGVLGFSSECFHFYCILHRHSCKQSIEPEHLPHAMLCDLDLHCLHVLKTGIWSELFWGVGGGEGKGVKIGEILNFSNKYKAHNTKNECKEMSHA